MVKENAFGHSVWLKAIWVVEWRGTKEAVKLLKSLHVMMKRSMFFSWVIPYETNKNIFLHIGKLAIIDL